MTGKHKTLFHSRGSTQHFLLSKTDTGRLRYVKTKEIADVSEMLKSAFPDMLVGRRFVDYAMQHLDAIGQFAAMVIRVDQVQQDNEKSIAPGAIDAQNEVAGILNTVGQLEKGLWGVLEPGLFGSFFPDKNGAKGLKMGLNVQKRLAEITEQTVTIGVASHPTLTYKKSEIVDNARKALDHATFFGPNSAVIFDAVSLNISGDKLYEEGKIHDAIKELIKAIKLEPSNVNVHNSLGVCYGLQGNYESAIEEFKTTVSIAPEEYMALYNLGLVHMLMERREKALEFFLNADAINGDIYEVAFQTGKLYMELGDPAKGIPYLVRASKLEPDAGTVYRYLAECYAARDMSKAAIAAYKNAIKKNPNDAASMSALGYLFDNQGENPEIALMFCRESVALSPQNGLFRYRLGRVYANQHRFDEALKEFKKAKQLGYDASSDIQEINDQLAASSS